MKQLLKWVMLVGVATIISAGIALGISLQISEETIARVQENSKEAAALCERNVTIRVIREEAIIPGQLYRPLVGEGDDGKEVEIYCVEPGAAISTSGISREYVQEVCDGSPYGGHGHTGKESIISDPYYKCDGVHYSESYSGYIENSGQTVDDLYDVGYLVSYYPDGYNSISLGSNWAGHKQQAIWWTAISSSYETRDTPYKEQATYIRQDSINYQDFYRKILEEDANGRTGMKPTDNTNKDEVKLDTDDTTDTHILGPFKIDYITGRYNNRGEYLTFGGISGMYLVDEDGNRIEIDMLIRPEQEESYKAPNYWSTWDPYSYDEPVENPNKVDYLDRLRNYPDPNEPFYVEFKYTGELSTSYKLHIDFQYMKATATVCIREGKRYYPYCYAHNPSKHRNHMDHSDFYRESFHHAQNMVYIVEANREVISESIEIPVDDIRFAKTMKLGGYVFEDTPLGKEQDVDGVMTDGDRIIPGAKVTLYEVDENGNRELAQLRTLRDEDPNATDAEVNDPDDYTRRINPTLSDANGYYEFRGLDTEKHYIVEFEYNGQIYMPTEYLAGTGQDSVADMVNANQYDTAETRSDQWRQTSKALEVASERTAFDQRFAEIRSYPENYRMNPDGLSLITGSNGYNVAFSTYDLMGFNLTADGTYEQILETPLIDTYYYLDNGVIMIGEDIQEGLITTRIREFINQNKKYPSDQELRTIYSGIVNEIAGDLDGGQTEAWRMLQFIEDSKISAYTINNMDNASSYDIYPVYEQFTTYVASGNKYPNNSYSNGTHDTNASTYEDHPLRKNDTYVTYKNIYEGQLFINCGLWRRQETDMALRKDVYKAALKINDKTVIYNYEKRAEDMGDETGSEDGKNNEDGNQDNQTYWDINLRMSDYEYYYDMNYNREIYETDYLYNTGFGNGHPGEDLEIYITYKITVRNQSMSILTEIEEVVDYYDQDYTFKSNLSWVMYKENSNDEPPRVDEDEYYAMMAQDQDILNDDDNRLWERRTDASDAQTSEKGITGARDAETSEGSTQKYPGTEKDDITESGYQAVYVNGLQNKKLASGESAEIYLTFQVNKENGRVILDGGEYSTSDTPKENIAEINGFTTYYGNGTTLPNYGAKGANDIAGLVDRDSTPGNLVASDLQGDRYEQNFEDDTDRAPSLRVIIDEDAVRQANGTVWEDQRTVVDGNAVIGNGIREKEDETGVSGVTVQLVEKRKDGSEYIWYETTSNSNGQYAFSARNDTEGTGIEGYIGFIPGDYVIRFKYGNTDSTALTSEEQPVSYNGQDFKSTVYQTGLDENGNASGLAQNANTDISGNYHGYTNTETQNESGTYGYEIYVADSNSTNYSDAKDLYTTNSWSGNVYILSGVGDSNSFSQASDYTIQGRQAVINYSDGIPDEDNSVTGITNHIAEVLASPYVTPSYNGTPYNDDEMRDLYKELIDETQMTAETGVIVVEFEYDRQQTDGLKSEQNNDGNSSKNYVGDNAYNSHYILNNIDFGLTERPKAQLEIDKSIKNVQVTLANGSILFDIVEAANNALWQDHQEYSIDEEKKISSNNDRNVSVSGEYYNPDEGDSIGMYEEYYGNDSLHRYSFRTERNGVSDIVTGTDKGLIQLTMDEELMHGATIQITYIVKITNVGEIDYVDDNTKDFYYRGDTSGTTVSTTTANQVVDYVQNNLQFDPNNEANEGSNSAHGWNVITVDSLTSQDLVNSRLENEVGKLSAFNTIAHTENFGSDNLVPGQETAREIVLSQVITPENTDDDLTYNNMVEIVKTSNTVGRRMAYSVVGNQDPSFEDASEVDANIAERVVILPPFGEVRIYYILGAVVAVMLIGGIILIRRKVLKGKGKTE